MRCRSLEPVHAQRGRCSHRRSLVHFVIRTEMMNSVSPQTRSTRPTVRLRWLAALAAVFVLAQPAAAQQRDRSLIGTFRNDAPETTTTLHAPAAAVWTALTEAYAEMGFPLATTANIRGHEFLSPFMDVRGQLFQRRNSDFFTCQQFDALADLTNTGQIAFAVRTRLEAVDDGNTVVHTQIDARARRRGTSGTVVECNTTGRLEEALVQAVARKLETPAAQPQPR